MSSRILVIEDDPASLELMRYLLESHGYQVLTAMRGDHGLELALEHRPDAIICDIQLPGRNGYDVASMLRQHGTFDAVPLVAVTALAMVGDRERVMRAGFSSYVSKPIDPAKFVNQLAETLGEAGQQPSRSYASASSAQVAAATLALTILVVDDSVVNLELKRSIFEPLGYAVLTTETVAEAMQLARSAQPALIISDIRLEERNGFELLDQLKSDPQLAHIPFVFITSTYDDDAMRAQALRLGASRYLLRPIEPQQLLQEIEACLVQAGASHGVHFDRR